MNDFSDQLLTDLHRRSKASRFRPVVFVIIPLAAILFARLTRFRSA